MLKRIMVPLDGSKFGEHALPAALGLAGKDTVIDLAMVIEAPPFQEGIDISAWVNDMEERQSDYVEGVAESISRDGQEVATTVLRGSRVDKLSRHAEASGADLIVMTSHGRGGLERVWLGSVADGLIRHAPAPVLVIRPGEEEPEPARPVEFAHIVVALDGSEASEQILGPARAVGDRHDARYTLLQVVRPTVTVGAHIFHMDDDELEQVIAGARENLEDVAARHFDSPNRVSSVVVQNESASASIGRWAEENGADLIALTTSGQGGIKRAMLGSVADKVLRGADKPILIYHPTK